MNMNAEQPKKILELYNNILNKILAGGVETLHYSEGRRAWVQGLSRSVTVSFLSWLPQLGVFRAEGILIGPQMLVGLRMLVGVSPVFPSSKVLKLRMPLEGVSMLTPSMLLTGMSERDPGLWGFTVSTLGWTWTNTGDSSSVGGSTFTWSEQELL